MRNRFSNAALLASPRLYVLEDTEGEGELLRGESKKRIALRNLIRCVCNADSNFETLCV